MHYKELILSKNNTYFLYNGENIFKRTFLNALKFHAEGLAPVQDKTGWFHINMDGKDLYAQRYDRTFGYYFKRAAVIKNGLWFHINTEGKKVYEQQYTWCGNYQENICTVRNLANQYYHINELGNAIYKAHYSYAGDFRDGFACIRLTNGQYLHVDKLGKALNNKTFYDLGVFHKSIATAKDKVGWFHINQQGVALYAERYLQIEPFYNGFALVETLQNEKLIIDETGKKILTL